MNTRKPTISLTAALSLMALGLTAILGCSDLERNNPAAAIASWRSEEANLSSNANTSSSSNSNSSSTLVDAPNYTLATDYGNKTLSYGVLNDVRDGQSYPTITIGAQTWMARNLNYSGDDGEGGRKYTLGWCYGIAPTDTSVHTDAQNCVNYGRSYQWAEAMGFNIAALDNAMESSIIPPHRGICPSGWHIPSFDEWEALRVQLHTEGVQAWKSALAWPDEPSNSSGFASVAAGKRDPASGWSGSETHALYWSASETFQNTAAATQLAVSSTEAVSVEAVKSFGLSVRCSKDL